LQLAIIVADIADTMRHIESGSLVAALIGAAANSRQGRALHANVAAALLVGAGWRRLPIGRAAEPGQNNRRK
jgi:hypothetical protein